MKKTIHLSLFLLFVSFNLQAQSDEAQIKEVVTTAYVNGIHNAGPIQDIKDGFHPAFKMMVLSNDGVNEVSIQDWVERIENGRKKNPPNPDAPKATGDFARVTVTGTNATVELHLMRNGRKVFTDNLALYKFGNGWKIVSKTFYRHPN